MAKFEVSFAPPEDHEEGETTYNLSILVTLPLAIVLNFDVENGELYTADEYRQFGKGELKSLTFTDSNGYAGIRRYGGTFTFETTYGSQSTSFSIPANHCVELFEKLVSEREKISVSPPLAYADLHATKVSFENDKGF